MPPPPLQKAYHVTYIISKREDRRNVSFWRAIASVQFLPRSCLILDTPVHQRTGPQPPCKTEALQARHFPSPALELRLRPGSRKLLGEVSEHEENGAGASGGLRSAGSRGFQTSDRKRLE